MEVGAKGPPPLPKISHTNPTMMKLGTIIPYLKKIQNIYESRDTSPEFCWNQHFSREISKFCYIKKYRYILHFGTEFLIILNFPESLKICLINLVIILMMSGLVNITVFWNKRYNLIISVDEVTKKIYHGIQIML